MLTHMHSHKCFLSLIYLTTFANVLIKCICHLSPRWFCSTLQLSTGFSIPAGAAVIEPSRSSPAGKMDRKSWGGHTLKPQACKQGYGREERRLQKQLFLYKHDDATVNCDKGAWANCGRTCGGDCHKHTGFSNTAAKDLAIGSAWSSQRCRIEIKHLLF